MNDEKVNEQIELAKKAINLGREGNPDSFRINYCCKIECRNCELKELVHKSKEPQTYGDCRDPVEEYVFGLMKPEELSPIDPNGHETDETRLAKNLDARNKFEWKVKYINDIESNGIDCWWTLGEIDNWKRFYKIIPQYYTNLDGGVISNNIEYYILFESLGFDYVDNKNESKEKYRYDSYDGILPSEPKLVHVFKNINDAKYRAYVQLSRIAALSKYIVNRK